MLLAQNLLEELVSIGVKVEHNLFCGSLPNFKLSTSGDEKLTFVFSFPKALKVQSCCQVLGWESEVFLSLLWLERYSLANLELL